jgi:cytochrome c peroxidase
MKTSNARLSFVAALTVLFTFAGLRLSQANPALDDTLAALKAKFRRPTSVPFPKDNPHTPAREALGKALFFDTRLSGSKAISCASCHNPAFSWGDGLPKGVGHGGKELGRRSPTILNVAWGELYFWDGRADSLEAQALGPVESAAEMNMSLEDMIASLKAIPGYAPMFEIAYPGEGVSTEVVAKAIATFERTVVSGIAPFDRWIAGEEHAIGESAKRGFRLFTGKALCSECHSGWNFTDDGFHDIGIAGDSRGRGAFLKQVEGVQYAFKTPTLRNVALRAPYMHDGSEKTLEDAVRFYNAGGKVRRPAHDINVKPLGLSDAEVKELCDFMETLTSHDAPVTIPVLPR